MVWGGALIAVGLFVASLLLSLRSGDVAHDPFLTPIAAELGARLTHGFPSTWIMEGREGGALWRLHVDIHRGRYHARPAVAGAALPGFIKLTREGYRGGGDPEVGDVAFDEAFHLEGDPAFWSAACTAEVRGLLLRQLEAGEVALKNGELMLRVDTLLPCALESVDDAARLRDDLLAVGRQLFPLPSQVPSRLLTVATDDPKPRVRRIAAGHLLSRHALHGSARALRARLSGSEDPTLKALATDDETDLVIALGDPDPPVVAAVCRALGRVGSRDCRLALSRCGHPAAEGAIARLDARWGAPSAGAVSVIAGGELSVSGRREAGTLSPR